MGTKLLPCPLFSLPTGPPALSQLSAVYSLFPLSSSSRLSIARTTPLGFQTAILSPATRRRRPLTVMAAADDPEVEVDGEGTLENDVANEDPEASEVDTQAEAKPQRKPRIKLGDIMGILNKRAIEASEKARPVPDIRTGDIVEIKLEVPENRRRLSIYKGIVISRQNAGIHTTIRIRRIIAGVGVEIVFPLYSPNMKEIKVVNHRKVRRARLYYLRDKLPRLSTFK